MMETTYRPTRAVIDLEAVDHNIKVLKKRVDDAAVIAVVKADAYGHGIIQIAEQALKSGASMLAVATPDEALHLRKNSVQTEILVLGASPVSFLEAAIKQNIIVTAYSLDWLKAAAAELETGAGPLKIHLKFDTGMRRIGFEPEQAEAAFALAANPVFDVTGMFTHFATADEAANPLFLKQVETIRTVRGKWKGGPLLFHISNSAAAIMHPELAFDAVRIGISLYGIAPSAYIDHEMPFELKRVMSLETEIIHVKKVGKGDKISYGATYTSPQDEWIATLPIGYADGLLRGLQGQTVLVKGERMPIVGRICMDQCMIRLPKELAVGEKVQLLGTQGNDTISIEEWAEKLDTIPYEIPCIITARVPRFYTVT